MDATTALARFSTKRFDRLFVSIVLTVTLTCALSAAQAATVSFTNPQSGNGVSLWFDPATTVAVGDGDTLQVGLDSFAAGTGTPYTLAVDNFSVNISALPGFFISSIDYAETYDYTVAVGGVAGITLTGDVDVKDALNPALEVNLPLNPAGAFFTGGGGTNVGINLDTLNLAAGVKSVSFSVSNSLFAFAPSGETNIGKTNAVLVIGTTPVPLPPAVGLLGAALVGLVTVGARRRA